MAGRQITKELALKIADKLKAIKRDVPHAAHDNYDVYHEGRLIASFGIRRSSDHDIGHDHIPKSLGVGPSFAKGLGQCPKSRNDYLRQIGELEDPDGADSTRDATLSYVAAACHFCT